VLTGEAEVAAAYGPASSAARQSGILRLVA